MPPTSGFLLNLRKCLVDMPRQVVQKHFVFTIVLEHLPQGTWLFPVFVSNVRGVGLYLANPFTMGDVCWTALDFAE